MDLSAILQLGNPKLRLNSAPFAESSFDSKEIHDLSDLLFKTLENSGGIGLAAPQIGINQRIIVFGMHQNSGVTNIPPIPHTVLINPSFNLLSDETEEDYEACLSVWPLSGKVQRNKHILYKGFDAKGQLIEREVEGLHARVFQHEYDHLDGIVFLDRVTDHLSLGFRDELIAAGKLIPRRTD